MTDTYDDRETSVAEGAPIEYYTFSRGAGDFIETWRYVGSQANETLNGDEYGALPGLERNEIQGTGESSSMQVTITLPRTACVAMELIGRKSPAPIRVTIVRNHRGLVDAEANTIFNGRVTDPSFKDSVATLVCSSEESAHVDALCRTYFQAPCPYMLYGTMCGADQDAGTFAGVITAVDVDAGTITVDETGSIEDHLAGDSTFYQAGVVMRPGSPPAFVTQQNGHVLTLQTFLTGAAVDDVVKLIAGCDHTSTGCAGHSNIERFGGFELLPARDPWAGVS